MALTYGEISAITEKYYLPKLVDNIFTSNVLFQRIKSGKMYETYSGGNSIMIPVAYAQTTAVGAYSGSQTLDTTANDQITSAEFFMKQYYANITITRSDELVNAGDAQKVDFVKAKVQLAEMSLADTMGTDVYNLGTDALKLVGLRLAVSAAGTYGGISRTSYSWWNAQSDATTTVLSIPALEAAYGDATVGNDMPTVIISTQSVFDDFHSLLQPAERYIDENSASAGFKSLMFRGVPLVVDNHCPSGFIYMLNEKYIKLFAHDKENFRFEPFQKPINQNVACAKIYWAGALTISNPRMQSVITSIA